VEALAALHVEAHGGDVERSLAAVPAGKSTHEGLAVLGDPDLGATLGHVASGHGPTEDGDDGADRTASYAVGTATSDGYEGMKGRASRVAAPDRYRLHEAAVRVVRLYEAWGRPDEAAEWKAKLGMPDLPAEIFARP
jgi:hypothetical protein